MKIKYESSATCLAEPLRLSEPSSLPSVRDCDRFLEAVGKELGKANSAVPVENGIFCALSLDAFLRGTAAIARVHVIVRGCVQVSTNMNETLSIRIDPKTKKRLDALSKRSKRSKSFLAAEAIAAYVDSEEWQLGEVQAGIAELDSGQEVSHEKVAKWLKSWGKPSENETPR